MLRAPSPMRYFDVANWPTRVVFGPGAVARLPALLAELGASRPLVICGKTASGGPLLGRVRSALVGLAAEVYTGVERHTPLRSIQAGALAARRHGADVLVSVGGGSAIDTAKCVALLMACEGDWEPYAIRFAERGSEARRALPPQTLPHLAVPTTAGSSSEVVPGAGCHDPERRIRLLFRDARLQPRIAVLDPEMAIYADPELTAASGMTAVARCVEALYSRDRQALSEGLALQGIRLLVRGLPRALARPGDLEARGECLLGCLLSGIAVDSAMASVVHAVGHVFGGRYGFPHGIAHAILLPPAMRCFLPILGDGCHVVAQATGAPGDRSNPEAAAVAASDRVAALVTASPLPTRLRDTGIAEGDLLAIAAAGARDHMIAYAPRPVAETDIFALLRSAW